MIDELEEEQRKERNKIHRKKHEYLYRECSVCNSDLDIYKRDKDNFLKEAICRGCGKVFTKDEVEGLRFNTRYVMEVCKCADCKNIQVTYEEYDIGNDDLTRYMGEMGVCKKCFCPHFDTVKRKDVKEKGVVFVWEEELS
jgi:ribosomal protein S27E